MFHNVEPVKFKASMTKDVIGVHNQELNLNEYICFSIWRNSGTKSNKVGE